MKNKLIVLSGLVLSLSPVVALAQTPPPAPQGCAAAVGQGTLFSILCTVGNFLNAVVPVLIALAVVYFIWGVVSFVIASDEEAKTTGRNRIVFGIIGLAVIVGMWGLVNILGRTFGIQSGANPTGVILPGVAL